MFSPKWFLCCLVKQVSGIFETPVPGESRMLTRCNCDCSWAILASITNILTKLWSITIKQCFTNYHNKPGRPHTVPDKKDWLPEYGNILNHQCFYSTMFNCTVQISSYGFSWETDVWRLSLWWLCQNINSPGTWISDHAWLITTILWTSGIFNNFVDEQFLRQVLENS